MKHFIFILFLITGLASIAQPPARFYCTYGGNGYDVGYDVKQTLDGGYIIVGSTSSWGQGQTDVYLLKLDSMGQKKFETTFGGFSNEIGKSIVQLLDSSYVLTGYTSSTGIGGYDVLLIKADKNGNLLWQKTIGGSDWDFAHSLQSTTDGGFIIAGTTYSFGHGNADGYIIKTDGNGDTTWTKSFGGLKDDEFKSVIQTSDGNYAVTGYTKSYSDSLGDAWILKINTLGDTLWRKFYGGNKEDFGRGILELQNSNILISGGTKSTAAGDYLETLIVTYDFVTGNQVYSYVDVSTHEEYYNDVIQGFNGSIANCGTTKNAIFGYDGLCDIYTISYGLVNFFSDGSTMYEEFYSIDRTKDKGFIAVGKTSGYSSVLENVFLMKMDSTGGHGQNIVGVKDILKTDIKPKIYPNPATSEINISIQNEFLDNDISYQLFDLSGKNIASEKISNTNTTIELSSFSQGLYILQLYSKNNLLNSTKISITK